MNKDQDAALALPERGQHLIVGGPGTGKSVMALLRARRLARDGRRYQTLVYNHLLNHANRHLFGQDQELKTQPWHAWFFVIWRESVGQVPTQESAGFRPIDWQAVQQQIESLPEDKIRQGDDEFLIIDEGQDMPPAFYSTLANLGFQNFYVAADQNQQIDSDNCSSRRDIENVLAIESSDTLELKTNYRNTRPVARLPATFTRPTPRAPGPICPAPSRPAATPELWTYGGAGMATLARIADRILKLGDRDPRKLIGIITPDNQVRNKFMNALKRAAPALDHGKPPISTFASGERGALPDFGQGRPDDHKRPVLQGAGI